MGKEVSVKVVGKYHGHNIKPNKSVDLTFVVAYDELTNYIKLVQMLNENVTIFSKLNSEKPKRLGMFMIKAINIDHDGQGTLKFNSQFDYVEADNLNRLIGEQLQIMFKATIECEEEEDDEDDEE